TVAAYENLAGAFADSDADAVVVVGGTGSGRRDASVRTLAALGEVIVHGVALLPGETTALGTVGARPGLGLPGRLDAARAAWHMLGRVMMARLAGNRETLPVRTAWLTHKVSSSLGLAELVPVRCEGVSATAIASGYVPLAALAQANGWVFIPAESEGHPAQTDVVISPGPCGRLPTPEQRDAGMISSPRFAALRGRSNSWRSSLPRRRARVLCARPISRRCRASQSR